MSFTECSFLSIESFNFLFLVELCFKFSFLFISYDSSLKNLLKLLFHMLRFYSLSALSLDRALFFLCEESRAMERELGTMWVWDIGISVEALNLLMIGHYII